jgi:WD40 repeat protein
MSKSNLRRVILFVCALLLSGWLAACGEERSVPVATPTSSPAPTTAPATNTAAPPATNTAVPATNTPAPPTATVAPATNTPAPTNTPIVPTPTSRPNLIPTVAPSQVTADANAALTAQAQPPATAVPTPTPATSATLPPNMVYFAAENSLRAINPDGSGVQTLAENVYAFVRTGNTNLIYLQQTGDGANAVLALKLRLPNREITLDQRVFVPIPGNETSQNARSLRWGTDSRVLLNPLAVSPDGTQLAYVKTNASATFDGFLGKERPTELWAVDLGVENATPRRLAPSAQNYIFQPVWSTDNNRVAFARTDNFGTGAGFSTAFWSVYKDGTRLAFLTGPDLGEIGGVKYRATNAAGLRWVGPLALTFVTGQPAPSLWLHDLSAGSDFPRPLAQSIASEVAFCPQIRRYFFNPVSVEQQFAKRGIYSINVDEKAVATELEPTAQTIYGCTGNSLLYQDGTGQILLRTVNPDGTFASEGTRIGNPLTPRQYGRAVLSPDGSRIAVNVTDTTGSSFTVYVFNLGGGVINTNPLNGTVEDLAWSTSQTLALSYRPADNRARLLLISAGNDSRYTTATHEPPGQVFLRIVQR